MTKALTGRLLVLLSDRSVRMSVAALRRAAGPQIATTLDVRSGHLSPEETEGADAVYFDKLGVAVVNVDPRDAKRTARIRTAAVENEARILAVEPERYVHAYATRRTAGKAAAPRKPKSPAGSERTATWGLQATGVPASKFSGKGVKVAVLVALWAEANPKATATELWTLLTQHARRLPLLATDVGAGLAVAP